MLNSFEHENLLGRLGEDFLLDQLPSHLDRDQRTHPAKGQRLGAVFTKPGGVGIL